MKILIVYASHNGGVRTCVERLEAALTGMDVTVADLAQTTPILDGYDTVILGASIHFGKLLEPAKRFVKANKEALLTKRLFLFLCCGLAHEYEYYREHVFSKELAAVAEQSLYFGGSLRLDGLSFWDRLVVRSIRSSIAESEIEDGEYTPSMPGLLPENVDRLATQLRKLG